MSKWACWFALYTDMYSVVRLQPVSTCRNVLVASRGLNMLWALAVRSTGTNQVRYGYCVGTWRVLDGCSAGTKRALDGYLDVQHVGGYDYLQPCGSASKWNRQIPGVQAVGTLTWNAGRSHYLNPHTCSMQATPGKAAGTLHQQRQHQGGGRGKQ